MVIDRKRLLAEEPDDRNRLLSRREPKLPNWHVLTDESHMLYPKRRALCEVSNNLDDGEVLVFDPYRSVKQVLLLAAGDGTNDETIPVANRFSSQDFEVVILRRDQAVLAFAASYSTTLKLHQPLEYMCAYVAGTRARLRGEGFRVRSGVFHEDRFVGQVCAFVILDLVVAYGRELHYMRLLPYAARGQSRVQLSRAKLADWRSLSAYLWRVSAVLFARP